MRVKSTEHGAQRKNNPPAERQRGADEAVERVEFPRRNNPKEAPEMYWRRRDKDPQLLWSEKDGQDLKALRVAAPPCYIQEVIHAKQLVEDLRRFGPKAPNEEPPSLFKHDEEQYAVGEKVGFYRHEVPWKNRLILGDSLQIMASLIQKDGLKGQVQCIFMDPPYGINFKSNFQPSVLDRDTKDDEVSTFDPTAIRAFRDAWDNDIHSYLTYLRDRLQVAHDLLAETGSIFFQIGDKNVHLVRCLLDEIFGEKNFIRHIFFVKTGSLTSEFIGRTGDQLLWYAKDREAAKGKFRPLFTEKEQDGFYSNLEVRPFEYRKTTEAERALPPSKVEGRIFQSVSLQGAGPASKDTPFWFDGEEHRPLGTRHWSFQYPEGMERFARSGRILRRGTSLGMKLYIDDYPVKVIGDVWTDTSGFATGQEYVVETRSPVIERCILMTTDPGDLVLDPTCGSGTTAVAAEKWGRRWITIDTAKVSITLARRSLMRAKFLYYRLADGEGHDVSKGFIYERVPHVTLGEISKNLEIDTIWAKYEPKTRDSLARLNELRATEWREWEAPVKAGEDWPEEHRAAHAEWRRAVEAIRVERQLEIDQAISNASAEEEELRYDRPLQDNKIVRVSGPFTVESLSPRRFLSPSAEALKSGEMSAEEAEEMRAFLDCIQKNLEHSGITFSRTQEEIRFTNLEAFNGGYLRLIGTYGEEGNEKQAAIFVGPQYGTIHSGDMEQAAREAEAKKDSPFDALFVLGFAFDAHASGVEGKRPSGLRVFRVHMNQDLQMGDLLAANEGENLFVVIGEPTIEVRPVGDDMLEVEIKGIDLFLPNKGEVRHKTTDHIAYWFVDTDYNGQTFFVRHAYFPGKRKRGKSPFEEIKTALKAEVNEEAWASLEKTVSRPFKRPEGGLIAVKAINHYGDEVLKVCEVPPRGSSGG